MNKLKIINLFFGPALLFSIAACTNHQGMGMMHGNDTMYMANWNWLLVVVGVVIAFLFGFAIARRKR